MKGEGVDSLYDKASDFFKTFAFSKASENRSIREVGGKVRAAPTEPEAGRSVVRQI